MNFCSFSGNYTRKEELTYVLGKTGKHLEIDLATSILMATFISQSSKNVSSFGTLDDLQCSSIHEILKNDDSISLDQQQRAEILAKKGTKNCDILTVPKVNITRESNNTVDDQKCSINDSATTKEKNIVAPSFSVGGLVSAHYQSQPNVNDEVNNYEDTNQRKFQKEPSSHSIPTHSNSVDHCLHDQINKTNLACVIQDAISKRCNVIHLDSTTSAYTQTQLVYYLTRYIFSGLISLNLQYFDLHSLIRLNFITLLNLIEIICLTGSLTKFLQITYMIDSTMISEITFYYYGTRTNVA